MTRHYAAAALLLAAACSGGQPPVQAVAPVRPPRVSVAIQATGADTLPQATRAAIATNVGLCLQDGAPAHWERDLTVTLHAAAAPTIGLPADSADALGRHVATTLGGAECLGKLRSNGVDSLVLLVAIRSEPRDPLPPHVTANGDTARFALEVDVPALPRAQVNVMPTYPIRDQIAGRSGYAVAAFVLRADGTPDPATVGVVEASTPEFADAVAKVASQWKYFPAQVAGVAVPQVVYQPAFFHVDGARPPGATPPHSMIIIGYKTTVRQLIH